MNAPNKQPIGEILANAEKMIDNGFPVDAVPYFDEGASILEKKGNFEGAAECYERIGYCYELDDRWSEAYQSYSKAKDMYLKAGAVARAKQARGAAEYARSHIG